MQYKRIQYRGFGLTYRSLCIDRFLVTLLLCRYIYNCLIHLCATLGRVGDALEVLDAMREEGLQREDCKPDAYTYR
jgi:pentatricopeptide repeat protein